MYGNREDRGRSYSNRDRWEERESSQSREGSSGTGWRERPHDLMLNNGSPRRDLLTRRMPPILIIAYHYKQ